MSKSKDISRLLDIMKALRTPETGCPWDIKQTHQSISHYAIEEAYEFVDAVERNDDADMRDELGDMLLQVVFHARIAEEDGRFDFGDVVEGISDKMIRRHPYVFGTDEEKARGSYPGLWDEIKAAEKAAKGIDDSEQVASALDGVPVGMSALTRCSKLHKKAVKVGFDWDEIPPVFDKVREELGELQEEVEDGTAFEKIEEEYGDLLFCIAGLGAKLNIDPETAMRKANNKFVRRFTAVEELFRKEGREIEGATLEEMDEKWDLVKATEKKE